MPNRAQVLVAATVLALLGALGCAQVGENDAASGAPADTSEGRYLRDDRLSAEAAVAFDPGAAQPDSGALWFRFRIPTFDNAGTCAAPIPDSTSANTDLYCIAWRGRRTDAGYGEVVIDTFWVARGSTVTYQRRVPADTFSVTFKLCKGRKCGCDRGASQIVNPSQPPAPEMIP